MLRRELRRFNQRFDDAEVLALCKHDDMDEFLANLDPGPSLESQVAHRLAQSRQETDQSVEQAKPNLPLSSPSSGITVLGRRRPLNPGSAGAAAPIPGDEILGFITRARGVTVHKRIALGSATKTSRNELSKWSGEPSRNCIRLG